MVQRAGGARLVLEALAASRVAGDVGRQHLESDGAAEARVACAIHLAHAARPEEGGDFVRPEPAARG